MSVRPYRDIHRRKSRQIMVGNVPVGGDAPITVQTMTNTLTSDPKATIAQIRAAEDEGVDIVRVSCPDQESTAALKEIVDSSNVPIVADIHFHYRRGIEAAEAGRVEELGRLIEENGKKKEEEMARHAEELRRLAEELEKLEAEKATLDLKRAADKAAEDRKEVAGAAEVEVGSDGSTNAAKAGGKEGKEREGKGEGR